MKRKAYNSEPVPFSLPKDKYKEGTRNYTYFIENENIKGYVEVKQLFDLLLKDPTRLTMQSRVGPLDFFPTKKFKITIDSADIINKGVVSPEDADKIVKEITWTINRSGLTKNYLMVLDLLATNNWERPVYFATTTGSTAYIGLEGYFQLEGLAYRLVPIKTISKDRQTGRIEMDIMYDNLVNKFEFGNMNDPNVYMDETNMRMTMNLRNNYFRLAEPLIQEGRYDSAKIVMDLCLEAMPDESIPYNYFVTPLAEGYYKIGDFEKGNELNYRLIEIFEEQLAYYFDFPDKLQKKYDFEKQQNLALLQRIGQVAGQFKQEEVANKASEAFDVYFNMYNEE